MGRGSDLVRYGDIGRGELLLNDLVNEARNCDFMVVS